MAFDGRLESVYSVQHIHTRYRTDITGIGRKVASETIRDRCYRNRLYTK